MVDEELSVRKERVTVTNGSDVFTITIRKRPWWFWALAGVWLLFEIVLIQTALASVEEGEYRAATISWIAFGVFTGAGCIAWLHRARSHSVGAPGEQH